ncbi:MarR family winged helix-turn-helix transcriptional regulator [Chloroflexota bacterium]
MDESKDIGFGLWQLLNRTRQLMYRARKRELHQYGVTTRSAAILEMTTRLGKKATQTALAKQTFTERHVVSEQLSRMEKEGLIIKIRDLERRNEVRVEATEKGKEVLRNVVIHQSINDVMSVLNNEDKLDLWRILSKLRESGIANLQLNSDSIMIYPPSDPGDF